MLLKPTVPRRDATRSNLVWLRLYILDNILSLEDQSCFPRCPQVPGDGRGLVSPSAVVQGRAGPTCGLEVLGDKWRVAAASDSWCCGLGVWVFVPLVAGQDGHSGTSGPAMT